MVLRSFSRVMTSRSGAQAGRGQQRHLVAALAGGHAQDHAEDGAGVVVGRHAAGAGVRHLLGRGYKIDPPLTMLMSSEPFGQFDRFIPFGPSLFL